MPAGGKVPDVPHVVNPHAINDLIAVQIDANTIQSADLNFRQRCRWDNERNERGEIWLRLANAVIATGNVPVEDVSQGVNQLIGQYDEFVRT